MAKSQKEVEKQIRKINKMAEQQAHSKSASRQRKTESKTYNKIQSNHKLRNSLLATILPLSGIAIALGAGLGIGLHQSSPASVTPGGGGLIPPDPNSNFQPLLPNNNVPPYDPSGNPPNNIPQGVNTVPSGSNDWPDSSTAPAPQYDLFALEKGGEKIELGKAQNSNKERVFLTFKIDKIANDLKTILLKNKQALLSSLKAKINSSNYKASFEQGNGWIDEYDSDSNSALLHLFLENPKVLYQDSWTPDIQIERVHILSGQKKDEIFPTYVTNSETKPTYNPDNGSPFLHNQQVFVTTNWADFQTVHYDNFFDHGTPWNNGNHYYPSDEAGHQVGNISDVPKSIIIKRKVVAQGKEIMAFSGFNQEDVSRINDKYLKKNGLISDFTGSDTGLFSTTSAIAELQTDNSIKIKITMLGDLVAADKDIDAGDHEWGGFVSESISIQGNGTFKSDSYYYYGAWFGIQRHQHWNWFYGNTYDAPSKIADLSKINVFLPKDLFDNQKVEVTKGLFRKSKSSNGWNNSGFKTYFKDWTTNGYPENTSEPSAFVSQRSNDNFLTLGNGNNDGGYSWWEQTPPWLS